MACSVWGHPISNPASLTRRETLLHRCSKHLTSASATGLYERPGHSSKDFSQFVHDLTPTSFCRDAQRLEHRSFPVHSNNRYSSSTDAERIRRRIFQLSLEITINHWNALLLVCSRHRID